MMNIDWFERIIVVVLTLLLMVMISVATVWLFVLFGRNVWATLVDIETALDLQVAVQRGMAGIFVVVLGLELLQTVKTYARSPTSWARPSSSSFKSQAMGRSRRTT